MARRDIRHASRDDTHAAFWGETPARPRPRRRTERGPRRSAGPAARRRRAGGARRPRGARGPADRLSVGAFALSIAVGLSLLAIVERALLDGGTPGASDRAGAERALRPRGGRAAPPPPRLPARAAPPRPRPSPAPDVQALTAQVRRLVLAQRGAAARQSYGAAATRAPLVATDRASRDRTWAFGTAAVPVPAASSAMPEPVFFAARWTGGRWRAALSGGTAPSGGAAAFGALLARMPPTLMSAGEAAALRRHSALTTAQAVAATSGARAGDGLVLPWRSGAAWALDTAGDLPARPLGRLAFAGGDGRVRSAGDGRLYRFCGDAAGRAMVLVVHRSGVASAYYGLRGVARLRDGSVVRRGETLGRTGADRPCGGAAASRPEVRFGLRRGAGEVPLDGARLGGWTLRERAEPLLGYAERGVIQVLPGGLLANLGPLPAGDGGAAPPPPPSGGPPEDGARPGADPSPSATQQRSPTGAEAK